MGPAPRRRRGGAALIALLLVAPARGVAVPRRALAAAPAAVGAAAAAQTLDALAPLGGIGSGFDLSAAPAAALAGDTLFPASLVGVWEVKRFVADVQGDAGQAENVWRALGGDGDFRGPETYATRFVAPPEKREYEFEGKTYAGVVLDRGFEFASRGAKDVVWDARTPGKLASSTTSLAVVERSSEPPAAAGFGSSNELLRLTSGPFVRAARCQRRYRRAFADDGERVVDGIELVKTYRVLDGVAGVEFPTSTTKSILRFARPKA